MRQGFAPRRKSRRLLLAGALATAVVVVGIAVQGMTFLVAVRGFLEFYTGAFSLVSLSLTVMVGLAATDRLLLSIRFRILLQIAHRVITTFGLAFLATHVILKISSGKAEFVNAFIPFSADRVAVSLGTVAALAWLMITLTGVFRIRFATRGQPWMWRLAHSMAYLCWPIAIVHGLTAGRAAALWVVLSYVACLIMVGLALVIRLVATFRAKQAGGRVVAMPVRRGIGMGSGMGGGKGVGAQPDLIEGMAADGVMDAEFWASLRREVRRRSRNEVRR
ncbi:hypothetical protein AB0K60_24130 [Thermopolyspora sp. NPDC052614]|uniref:hypothetical protein n=1 Tax=Thermopolyspora sp. NPDC052614 TaxID=3155682 RepID=UPI0034277ED8